MGSQNGKPPVPGGLDYFTNDLASDGKTDNSAMGHSEMLNTLAPASRPGDKAMRVDPRAPSTGADTVIGGK